jgi:hypothetical protein
MGTFVQIGIYSVFVLVGLSLVSAALIFVSTWLVDQSEDHEAH